MLTKSFTANILATFLFTVAMLPACTKQTEAFEDTAKSTFPEAIRLGTMANQSYVIDQSNTEFLQPFYYNINLSPIGQEFTPTLHAMDAVELQFDDASCSLSGSEGGNVRLLIRTGNINGKIIGTSETLHFPNCFVGIMRFNFPYYIPLTPGNRYMIQPEYVSGNTSSFYLNNYSSSYAGGSFILRGILQPEKDLWFREGLFNFIALTKDQAKGEGWKHLVRLDGTPFKNQGDCIQYINNGH